jgi:N-acetylmuramoyl-L-alanine amidase
MTPPSRSGNPSGSHRPRGARRFACVAAAAVLTGCAAPAATKPAVRPAPSTVPAVPPRPAPAPTEPIANAPPLPAIPHVSGPLAIKVVYPQPNQLLAARDTNFIFGSVGSGDATLTIDDIPVRVEPNGAFIAWIPVPSQASPRYRLVASVGADTVRATHAVRLPAPRTVISESDKLFVESASATPRDRLELRGDEPVRVSVRATPSATAFVRDSAGMTWPLVGAVARAGARALRNVADSALFVGDVPSHALGTRSRLFVARGSDTTRIQLSAVKLVDEAIPQLGILVASDSTVPDTDRVTIGRPTPTGTYRWLLLPGTVVPVTGRTNNAVRVRLDQQLEVWVDEKDIRPMPPGTPQPRRVVSVIRSLPAAEWVDIVVPTGDRPPFLVQENGREITLTLYATIPSSENVGMPFADPLVRSVTYDQPFSDRARVTVHLNDDVYGYLVFWNGNALVLRLRRPPAIADDASPLRGLTIAVDPGHPPVGSTGPTGLYEGVATLAVGTVLKAMLEERGATVVMTRTTPDPVPLNDRPTIGRRANVHALVSLHLNALPDGANPFTNRGTGTYHYFPHSQALAAHVQQHMVQRLGLYNEGVYYQNLAVARNPWFPAILVEAAYIMRPDHEAALRTPEFQSAYALGVVEGLEAYFRARRQGP